MLLILVFSVAKSAQPMLVISSNVTIHVPFEHTPSFAIYAFKEDFLADVDGQH